MKSTPSRARTTSRTRRRAARSLRATPADLLELAVLAERLGDRQVVDLSAEIMEPEHRREHGAVLLAVEVLRAQVLVGHESVQVPLVEQDGAEHRSLGLEVMRGDREGCGVLAVGGSGARAAGSFACSCACAT